MRFIGLFAAAIFILVPWLVSADADSSNKWTKGNATAANCSASVNPGNECWFYFGANSAPSGGSDRTSSGDSAGLSVRGSGAVICFEPDMLTSGGTATAVLWMGVTAYTDNEGFVLPSGTLNGTNCYTVAPGLVWLKYTPVAGEASAVKIRGI